MLVVDASAAVKLLLPEPGADLVDRLWSEDTEWHAPTLVLPEVAAAIVAAQTSGRLTEGEAAAGQDRWGALADELTLHVLDEPLSRLAAELTRRGQVRGADAVYLATCQRLAAAGPVVLVSFDLRQRAAAERVPELALVPHTA